jgi:hypothetical protein
MTKLGQETIVKDQIDFSLKKNRSGTSSSIYILLGNFKIYVEFSIVNSLSRGRR